MAKAPRRRFVRGLCGVVASALVLSGCDWTMFRYGPARAGFDPTESTIGISNVANLQQKWAGGTEVFSSVLTEPVVAGGVVYVVSNATVYAFQAGAGSNANCSGLPRFCNTLWTAPTGGFIDSSPAVVNGTAYVNSTDGKLYAFDATGHTNCSGSPKTCAPLWTAPTGGFGSSPLIADGVVYVGSGNTLYALDAAGVVNCSGSPKTCTPLWSAGTGGQVLSSPAVVNRVAYVGSGDGKLYAFDASGKTHCSGSPKKCTPVWTAATGGMISTQAPAIAGGVVYIASFDKRLYAFDAAGSTHCSGTPKTCTPLWTATTAGVAASAAVAKGVVYVFVELSGEVLSAFDAAGSVHCSGVPKTCTPLWTASPGGSGGGFRSPTVANGVVYVSAAQHLLGFDAAGTVNCSGSPRVCTPLWTAPHDGLGVVVANGMVYLGSSDGNLYAFGLP
jgi:outer membrane protein assembly factor BamB